MLKLGKKGVSNVIGYVLLISITIALSIIVYGWLRFYVSDDSGLSCSKDVYLVIKEYSCNSNELSLTLENKGLFNVDGYVLRVHDRPGARNGFYLIDNDGNSVLTGEDFSTGVYDVSEYDSLTFVEVQPYLIEEGERISCGNLASQSLSC